MISNQKKRRQLPYRVVYTTLLALLLISFFASFLCGRYSAVTPANIPKVLLRCVFPAIEETWTITEAAVILEFRLPRIIASIMVGAALAMSGAAYQALFSNPVASPDTLGVSSGAAFGAALGIILSFGSFGMKISAFAFGCLAVFVVYLLSTLITRGRGETLYLLLIGMVVTAVFSALLAILKYVADPESQLPQITYWLMGSFGNVSLNDVRHYSIFFLTGSIPLFLLRWRINLLSLSNYEAKAIGENTNVLRVITILCATMLTAASTAITGGVSWVGLIIPHIARLLVGYDFKRVLPTSALIGSVFLLLMDDLARTVSVNELPISVLTSIVGAPIFFIVLTKFRGRMIEND